MHKLSKNANINKLTLRTTICNIGTTTYHISKILGKNVVTPNI